MKETAAGCFGCFFHHVGQAQKLENNDHNDANDDEFQELATPLVIKADLASEAIFWLEDDLCFLESKGNIDTADAPSRVISYTISDWLECSTSQSKVTKFFSKSWTLLYDDVHA